MSVKRTSLNGTTADVVNLLNRLDLDYIIAGGYPRDISLGVEPKDMDIAIYNYTDEALNKLRNFLELHKMLGTVYTNSSMSDRDPRIDCVITTNEEYDLDFIVWNEVYDSYDKILDNFDVNLNQFILQKMIVGDGYVPIFVGNDFGTLVELRGDVVTTATEERRYKMQQKALSFGWNVPNPIENPNENPF